MAALVMIVVMSVHDMNRLALASDLSFSTVRRAMAGCVIEETTRRRLERAARDLNLPMPPPARNATSRPALEASREPLEL